MMNKIMKGLNTDRTGVPDFFFSPRLQHSNGGKPPDPLPVCKGHSHVTHEATVSSLAGIPGWG